MTVVAISEERRVQEFPETLPELLHRLQQPITALHCALEVGLMKPRSSEEYRALLERALIEADRALGLATTIQERIARVLMDRT